jgi:hypothetical protein
MAVHRPDFEKAAPARDRIPASRPAERNQYTIGPTPTSPTGLGGACPSRPRPRVRALKGVCFGGFVLDRQYELVY